MPIAVEGDIDAAIVRRICSHLGVELGPFYVTGGKDRLRTRIEGYNSAARTQNWFVLTDLDGSHECAPALVQEWLPQRRPQMRLRVAICSTEAWLMADADQCAAYFQVSRAEIPGNVESFIDAKSRFLDLIRQSRSAAVRGDMLPTAGSGRRTGRNYGYRVIEYVSTRWRPLVAAASADSLRRAMDALRF